jgi:hypothetical protein
VLITPFHIKTLQSDSGFHEQNKRTKFKRNRDSSPTGKKVMKLQYPAGKKEYEASIPCNFHKWP